MDDPTRRCENDTDNETHSRRPPIPSGGLIFFRASITSRMDSCASFTWPEVFATQEVNSAAASLTLLKDESPGWHLSR